MGFDRFFPSGTISGYNQPKYRLYDYEPHVTYPPAVASNQEKNPVNNFLDPAPAGPIIDDDQTDSYMGAVSPKLMPPTKTKGSRKYDINDNMNDMQDNDDDMTTEINESDEPPPPPHPTRGLAIGTARVAKYSYFYLARSLWYIPLWALLWYSFYVSYLVVKSIGRHKVSKCIITFMQHKTKYHNYFVRLKILVGAQEICHTKKLFEKSTN